MCGICGFLSKEDISLEQLKKMNDTMYHRGPNDSGEEIYPLRGGYSLGLAQRRLSIQDLSELGHQPMHTDNKRISIVFNGEIYNFPHLKEELSDYPFKSDCDTEVILAAYLKWGISCVSKFNGMFAIALYDREIDTLYLIRDRIGKKPLYYWYQNENIVFASELKPIMETPNFKRQINLSVMQRYLYQQCINAPETIFEHTYKLEPGAILTFKQGKTAIEKYWDISKVYREKSQHLATSYQEAKHNLKNLLVKSVEKRMIADVPLGTFLSGGYDSSLITAMAQSLTKDPVKTFSIGFKEEKYNEAKFAKEVSDYLGTNHTELYIDEKEMFDLVESIAAYYDEPFADSSEIPTMLVSSLASKDVSVALSGDGGDEFFCGYNVYEAVKMAQKIDVLGGMTYGVSQIPGIKQLDVLEKMPFKVRTIARNRNVETKTQMGGENYINVIEKMIPVKGIDCKFPIESQYTDKDWQVKRMLLDMDTYLPGDILCKVDRAAMKYSLETRCPILDVDVMEYSFQIPHEYKYCKGDKKHILKDIAYDYIPKEMLDRPKVGFGVPLDQWLRGPLKDALLDMSEQSYLEKQGVFDAAYVSSFIRRYIETGDRGPATGENFSKTAWSFFVFQQWYERYCL